QRPRYRCPPRAGSGLCAAPGTADVDPRRPHPRRGTARASLEHHPAHPHLAQRILPGAGGVEQRDSQVQRDVRLPGHRRPPRCARHLPDPALETRQGVSVGLRLGALLILFAAAALLLHSAAPVTGAVNPASVYAVPTSLGEWTSSDGVSEDVLPIDASEK